MALDLQPALDVQPADAGGLDLQPVQPKQSFIGNDPYGTLKAQGYPDPYANTTDFMRAVVNDPKGFVKALPGDVESLVGGVSALPYKLWSHAVQATMGEADNSDYPGEQPELTDKYLADLSKTSPGLATISKINKGVAEAAPMVVVGGLPAKAQKLITRGFTADMLYHAPGTVKELYAELAKPKAEQDPDKITSLISDSFTQLLFGGAGAAHELAGLRTALVDKYVPRGEAMPGTRSAVTVPLATGKPGNAETFSEFGGDTTAPLDLQPVPDQAVPGPMAAEAAPLDAQPVAAPAATPPPGSEVILRKMLNEASAAREPLPVALLKANGVEPQALSPGYALNAAGDAYEFTEPAKAPTATALQAQENLDAVKGLSGAKLSAGLDLQPAEPLPADTAAAMGAKVVPVAITPEEYSAARQGLEVGAPVAKAAGLAKDAKRAQLFADTAFTERPGQSEPVPAMQLFLGDDFQLTGQPVKVTELVNDAETGQPDHVRVSGAFGDQTIPANEVVHIDKGTLSSPGLGQAILGKLDSLKLDTNGQLHAFGLLPEVWNTLVDGIKLAVRGGMALKDAIDAGISKLKQGGQAGEAFDENGARTHLLASLGERATGIKVNATDQISDQVKAGITNWVYEKRTNVVDALVGDGLVKEFGVDAAIETFNHPPANFPEAVRSALIRSIGRQLALDERAARQAGDEAAANAVAQKAARFWDDALARSTELAQGLQAMRAVTDFSPAAVVARTKLELEKAAQQVLNKIRDQLTAMRQALGDGRSAGIAAVAADHEVNASARAAVDAAVKASPEVQRGIVMELAPVWAQVPHILNTARELVRSKAKQLLGNTPLPPGLTAGQHFRLIADDLAKRAATIFAGHVQGADAGVPLVDKFMQRLGIERGKAVQLATSLSTEWEAQLKIARDKLDKRIAMQRARQLKREAEAQTDPLVDLAIRRQLRELNQKLGEALRQAPAERDALGKHIADRVVDRSGLTGPAADQLRASLKRRWDVLVGEGQQKALEALAARAGVKLTPKLRSAFDRLVEIDRLGGLTDPKFLDTVKTALKLKQLTPADAAHLKDLVETAQGRPEGFLRDQAAVEILKYTEKLKGEVTWRDVPMAIFYANVLSGITTPAKIAFENMNLLAGTTIAGFISRPKELLNPVDLVRAVAGAYGRGIVKGGLQAQGTLRSGVVSGVWESPRHTGIMEMKPFGERMEPLNFWKWFTRVISTAHELTFKPSWEIRQLLAAREMARTEGLAGAALNQRVADLLANTPAEVGKARSQALLDLPGGNRLDLARRTREIIEQTREERMPGSTAQARDFALRTAYLNEPYGLLGMFAGGVRSVLEKMRKEFPIAGTAAKTQIPFTTVVANILNEKLNWTPVGLLRAAISHKTEKLYGREIMDPHERAELYARAIVGTAVLGLAAEYFGPHLHGNGPSDPNKRKQLQAAGWIPHSIEYHGRFYSYMNTPAALGLAIIGNTKDWERYGHGSQADSLARFSFVTKATAQAIVSQGMLDSLKRFFEAIGSEDTSDGANKLEKLAARTAGSFVVPNLVQQADRFFDPKIYDATGVQALVLGQIPFIRRDNKPVLNVLGEPVESAPFHYWESKATTDALWRVLVAQQAFIPTPAKEQLLGNPKAGPEFARAMTPDEYYNWIAESGAAIRERLSERLDELATVEPKAAQAIVTKVAEEERAKAKPEF